MTTSERFTSKICPAGDCMVWTSVLNSAGYGRFYLAGKMRLAHRLAYEWEHGPIPEGMQLDHLCRNRRCVKVEHLQPVSQRENILRGVGPTAAAARAVTCPYGHPYDVTNTRISPQGYRRCRACSREKHRRKAAALAVARAYLGGAA